MNTIANLMAEDEDDDIVGLWPATTERDVAVVGASQRLDDLFNRHWEFEDGTANATVPTVDEWAQAFGHACTTYRLHETGVGVTHECMADLAWTMGEAIKFVREFHGQAGDAAMHRAYLSAAAVALA